MRTCNSYLLDSIYVRVVVIYLILYTTCSSYLLDSIYVCVVVIFKKNLFVFQVGFGSLAYIIFEEWWTTPSQSST